MMVCSSLYILEHSLKSGHLGGLDRKGILIWIIY